LHLLDWTIQNSPKKTRVIFFLFYSKKLQNLPKFNSVRTSIISPGFATNTFKKYGILN